MMSNYHENCRKLVAQTWCCSGHSRLVLCLGPQLNASIQCFSDGPGLSATAAAVIFSIKIYQYLSDTISSCDMWVFHSYVRTVLTNKNILPGRVRQSNISPNVFPHSSRPDNRQISAGPPCQWHSNGDSINSIHSRLTWRLSLICSRLFLSHSCSSPGFFVLRTNSDIHFYCWYLVNLRFSFPLASSVINLSSFSHCMSPVLLPIITYKYDTSGPI